MNAAAITLTSLAGSHSTSIRFPALFAVPVQHSLDPHLYRRVLPVLSAAFLSAAATIPASAQWIPLYNATASFTQPHNFATDLWNPSRTIDGFTDGLHTSWAISHEPPATDTVIVWATESNLDLPDLTSLRFDLFHRDFIPIPGHNIGRFRLSYTTDDRSLFADGLADGGDVEAHWTVIPPALVFSTDFEDFTILPDQSVLAGGFLGDYPVYTVLASVAATGITGFRLETLTDESLPFGGPGRQPVNGNFHLSEFVVSRVGIQDRSVELSRELTFRVFPSDFGVPYETPIFELGTDAPEGPS